MIGRICVCVKSIPADEHAVQLALQLRASTGWEVVLVSMAPASAIGGLLRALAMGANRATLVSDPALAGSDVVATSAVVAAALRRESPDLVIFGSGSDETAGSMLWAAVSERLDWPLMSRISSLTVQGRSARAVRRTDRGGAVVEAELPAVIGLAGPIGTPRRPTLPDIVAARRKRIDVITVADLGMRPEDCGLCGSRTEVRGVRAAPPRVSNPMILEGDDAAERLFAVLLKWGIHIG